MGFEHRMCGSNGGATECHQSNPLGHSATSMLVESRMVELISKIEYVNIIRVFDFCNGLWKGIIVV